MVLTVAGVRFPIKLAGPVIIDTITTGVVHKLGTSNVTRGKVNAFERRGFENPVSASQSEQKAFVFELSNDLLIGQSAVRLSSRKHSLSFEPH